jgi:signal transduction histidine kinase
VEGERAAVYIIDNGVGIGADEIDRVFERLYRGRSADAGPTDTRGLGLGLYFSERIVTAHGGTISIQSEVDFGTVVSVKLPLLQVRTSAELLKDGAALPAPTSTQT